MQMYTGSNAREYVPVHERGEDAGIPQERIESLRRQSEHHPMKFSMKRTVSTHGANNAASTV